VQTGVLIHGLWMTPSSREHGVARYEPRGMKATAPGHPRIEPGRAGVEALRRGPSPSADLGVREVFHHLSRLIGAPDAKPIIM
jgi:hypothetical protein